MTSRRSRIALVIAALTAIVAGVRAEDLKKCSASARECEQEIRQMLSGRRYFGALIGDLNPGVGVKSVSADGPALRAGLREGDRIVAVNGRSMLYASSREWKQSLADAKGTGNLLMIVQRRGAYRKVDVRLEPFPKAQIDKIVAAHLAQSHGGAAGSQ